MAFKGWPPEALTFYEGLEADNSKAYWNANREIYEQAVRAPMEALAEICADLEAAGRSGKAAEMADRLPLLDEETEAARLTLERPAAKAAG